MSGEIGWCSTISKMQCISEFYFREASSITKYKSGGDVERSLTDGAAMTIPKHANGYYKGGTATHLV